MVGGVARVGKSDRESGDGRVMLPLPDEELTVWILIQ